MTGHDDYPTPRMPAIPGWLINEQLSIEGERLRTEWMKIAGEADDRDTSNGHARLGAAMLMLQSERPSRPLLAKANARALRWADTMIRESRLAVSLQSTMPELPLGGFTPFGCLAAFPGPLERDSREGILECRWRCAAAHHPAAPGDLSVTITISLDLATVGHPLIKVAEVQRFVLLT